MSDLEQLLVVCDNHPGEITPLRMFADQLEELGMVESAAMVRSGGGFLGVGVGGDGGGVGGVGVGGDGGGVGGVGGGGVGGGVGGVGGGDGGDGGDGDGGGGGGGDGGDGDGGGGGGGDGDGGGVGVGVGGVGGVGGGGGDGYKLSRGLAMTRYGLYIICSPGGYYPYVRVGWCTRNDGMIAMQNCRLIRRFGTSAQLAKMAIEGPLASTQLLEMSPVEYLSAGMASRIIPCPNPKKWADWCPEPRVGPEDAHTQS